MDDLTLDHVLIAVRDLDATRDSYSALGFQVTPEGRHPGRGTSNRLVVFGPDYLELISVRESEEKLFDVLLTILIILRYSSKTMDSASVGNDL